MSYRLQIDTRLKKCVVFSEKLAKQHFERIPKKISVCSGAMQYEVSVSLETGLDKETILFSQDIFNNLLLPQELPYDIVLEQTEMKIGPVIGLLLHNRDKKYTPWFFERCNGYILDYQNIRGLLFVFSSEGIDVKNKTVSGYYFNPYAKEGETTWEKGIFSYPDVIYRRIGIKDDIYEALSKEMGNKIFNYPWFGKKQMWNWLSDFDSVRQYLPETRSLKKIDDFFDMFKKYSEVYIKLAGGTKGFGLIKATLKGNAYLFRFNKKKEEKIFYTVEEVSAFIAELLAEPRPYLIQQSIDMLSYKERKIDFRFIMQKDHTKEWQCTGIIARFGKKGGIATNFQRAGFSRTFEEALKKATKLKYKEIYQKKQEMIQVCKKIACALDEMGNCYGDFGMDMAMDENLNVWIIEANNRRHEHRLPLFIHDEQMYYEVKSNPVRYAKALAGF